MDILLSEQVADPENVRENFKKIRKALNSVTPSGAAWGGITGTLSDQTDLQAALDAKENTITSGTSSQYWRGDKTWQSLESAVLSTGLSGISITGGAVTSSDNVLSAFGKLQNQINAVLGGATYQGVWNASTDSPSLASGVGTKGFYYVVSVDGSTNLDGITDWKVGDWAIFNGTTWDKVDNTDAVSSVNGAIGAISLAGTANRISVSGTTFDIASTYAGQSSINTLGTIATGTWNAGVIGPTYGGTGLSSYAKGDVLIATGTNVLGVVSAASTDGYVFTWDAASGLPMWKAAGGGSSLPDMTGNGGKYLTTDGTTASWGLLTGWALGGNTTGATASIGTNDNYSLVVKANNITGMTVTTGGNVIIGGGNTPSTNLIYLRFLNGNPTASVGFGLNSSYQLGMFAGTTANPFTWYVGGSVTGTQIMSLSQSGALTLAAGLTMNGAITGISSLSISGALACSSVNTGGGFATTKLYIRNLGTGQNDGIASAATTSWPGTQFFARPTYGWSWIDSGDYNTGTPIMWLNATRLALTPPIKLGSIGTPDSSALLEMVSTTKGSLLPRMTTTQKNAIALPAEGLEVYDTTLHKKCVYTGSAWETIASS